MKHIFILSVIALIFSSCTSTQNDEPLNPNEPMDLKSMYLNAREAANNNALKLANQLNLQTSTTRNNTLEIGAEVFNYLLNLDQNSRDSLSIQYQRNDIEEIELSALRQKRIDKLIEVTSREDVDNFFDFI